MEPLPARIRMTRLPLVALAAAPLVLGGCDPLAGFDPTFAEIDEVRVEAVSFEGAAENADPSGVEGAPEVFVRLVTATDTFETAVRVATGAFPLVFPLPRSVAVMTSDDKRAGQDLVVEVRDCDRGGVAGCAESDLLGRLRAGPDGWRGRERVLTSGGAVVVLPFDRYES